jgi:hypothetical protein
MTAVRHLHAVPDPPLDEWEAHVNGTPMDAPDPAAPRGSLRWRPMRWWRLLDQLHAQLERQPVPWEQHPARAAQLLEFRAP